MTESTDKSRVNFIKLKIVVSYWSSRIYSSAAGPQARKTLVVNELHHPKTESWQSWHIPLMWNSFSESLSLKESSLTLAPQQAQDLSLIDCLRSMPKSEVIRVSISWAFSVGCGFHSVFTCSPHFLPSAYREPFELARQCRSSNR